MKHLLTVSDLTKTDVAWLLEESKRMKRSRESSRLLSGKSSGLIFFQPSTRTRVSFEVAMTQLGGNTVYIDANSTQITRGETVADTAKTLSRYLDVIVIRSDQHTMLEEFAANSSIPLINGLSDKYHPCQALSDLLTIVEKFGRLDSINLTYIGDGNNVANSLILVSALTGMNITLASPKEYTVSDSIIEQGLKLNPDAKIKLETDPIIASEGADVLYTDVWVSMDQDDQKSSRMQAFQEYKISQETVDVANKDAIVMHCLPAHRGLEIDPNTLDGPQSVVFDQAENRLHMQKAILLALIG
ncbi:MAG: ornithine carbamoyltransferase [Nitrospinota bacterium]